MNEPSELPLEVLNDLLLCDPLTGLFTWRVRPLKYFKTDRLCNSWNKRFAGKPALATPDKFGYLRGAIFRQRFSAARIVYAMTAGAWPKHYIDHINGIRTDNRFSNLRDATAAENAKNKRPSGRNSSGSLGVCFENRSKKWRAFISSNGMRINLGDFRIKQHAINARRNAEVQHAFHPNHGQVLERAE